MLTDAGKTERDTIFKLQREVRRRAMQGITDQEYAIVLDVLQRPRIAQRDVASSESA